MDHVSFNNSHRKILTPHRLLCSVIKMVCNWSADVKPAYTHPPSEWETKARRKSNGWGEKKTLLPRRESSYLHYQMQNTEKEKLKFSKLLLGKTEWNITEALDKKNCHCQKHRISRERKFQQLIHTRGYFSLENFLAFLFSREGIRAHCFKQCRICRHFLLCSAQIGSEFSVSVTQLHRTKIHTAIDIWRCQAARARVGMFWSISFNRFSAPMR